MIFLILDPLNWQNSWSDYSSNKEKRACTRHPISNFVSYEGLPLSYKAFATVLIEMQIRKNVQKDIIQPEWKKFALEEIHALKKNTRWEYTELLVWNKLDRWKWLFSVKDIADEFWIFSKPESLLEGLQSNDVDYKKPFTPVAKFNSNGFYCLL